MNQLSSCEGRRDSALAIALLCVALFFSLTVPLSGDGPVFPVAFLLFCAAAVLYLVKEGALARPRLLWALLLPFLLSLTFPLFDAPLRMLSLCCAALFGALILFSASGCSGAYYRLILLPFCHFDRAAGAIGALFRKDGRRRKVLVLLLSLLVAVPLLVVAGALLSFDTAFGALTDRLLAHISFSPLQWFPRLILAALLFFCWFSLLFGLSHRQAVAPKPEGVRLGALPLIGVLTPLLLLYLLFFASQLLYFLDVSRQILPVSFSYADYARSGFFNLAAIALCNLVLTLLIRRFASRGPTAKVYALLLSGFTFPFILLALFKMWLYIGKFALTPMRVYVTVFLVALLLFFILLVASIFRERLRLFPAAVALSCLMLLGLSYGRCDRQIARYNIELSLRTGSELDWELLSSLSDDAVPEFFLLEGSSMQSEYNGRLVNTFQLLLDLRANRLIYSEQQNLDTRRAKALIPDYRHRADRFYQTYYYGE